MKKQGEEVLIDCSLAVFMFKTEENKKVIRNLNNSGIMMYYYVQGNMVGGTQEITIVKDKFKKDLNIKSSTTFYSGIKQLVSAGVITRKGYNKYIVNERFMICGYGATDSLGREYIVADINGNPHQCSLRVVK